MPKSTQIKNKIKQDKKVTQNSIWDVFKFGESYTSLILGIIVVVIATLLLLIFVKGKNTATKTQLANQITQEQKSLTPTVTQKLLTPEQKNTTIVPTKIVVEPTIAKQNVISGTTYTVKEGDNLWTIAEQKYKSGFNWVDIQKANNLKDSNVLFVGTKLKLPNVSPKIATIEKQNTGKQQIGNSQTNKITGTSYTIAKGDTLWNIAVRAYGDGYAWTKISQTNKLSNPDIIHSGNKITIPRG